MASSVDLVCRCKLVRVQGGWQHSAFCTLMSFLQAFAQYGGESNRAPVVWACYLTLLWYRDDD